MSYQYILYDKDERVAKITLNRPKYRNALSRELQEELEAAFNVAKEDDDVRVIVLAGNGPAFCAGHDLGTPEHNADLERRPILEPEVRGNFEYAYDTVLMMPLRLRDIPKPTIASVHGWCIYGGWKLASAMDIIVAADDARFIPGPPQWINLAWEVGPRRAKALLLDDHALSAQEAFDVGIVYKVFSRDQLEAETMAMAKRIAERPPFMLHMMKMAVNQAQDAQGYRSAAMAAIAYRALFHSSGEQPHLKEGERRQLPAVKRAIEAGPDKPKQE
ncbi:MAG TPA: enoyl-CoA hydratase-related protein [Bacillota bacterium]|nr:enoyl-CoA hydratase-related protein [Bacillota bacterium]